MALLGAGCLWVGFGLGQRGVVGSEWPAADAGGEARAIAPASFADVVERVGPGVVSVVAHLPPVSGRLGAPAAAGEPGQERQRNGSGFVVHRGGLVVTCRHVVQNAQRIEVWLRGACYQAALVGEDRAVDLVLLRMVDPPAELTVLPLGTSETLRAGDWILALGSPCGLPHTVTVGVVSHPGRQLPHSDLLATAEHLQCSAPVNPGCSGGPLVDTAGRVVGVITQAAAATQGISFAVPARTVAKALAAMERSRDGQVRHGCLGIEFRSGSAPDARGRVHRGALVLRVVEGQPAERAGLRSGDLVVGVGGEPVDDVRTLHERIVHGEPGSSLALSVLRGGRIDPIDAELGELGGRRSDPAN